MGKVWSVLLVLTFAVVSLLILTPGIVLAAKDDFSTDTTANYDVEPEVEFTWNSEGYVTLKAEANGWVVQGDDVFSGTIEAKLRITETFADWGSAGVGFGINRAPGSYSYIAVALIPNMSRIWSGWRNNEGTKGTPDELTGLTIELNTWYILKVVVDGDSFKAKYWEDGAEEPDWQLDGVLPGEVPSEPGVGIRLWGASADFDYIEAPPIYSAVAMAGKLATTWGNIKAVY